MEGCTVTAWDEFTNRGKFYGIFKIKTTKRRAIKFNCKIQIKSFLTRLQSSILESRLGWGAFINYGDGGGYCKGALKIWQYGED